VDGAAEPVPPADIEMSEPLGIGNRFRERVGFHNLVTASDLQRMAGLGPSHCSFVLVNQPAEDPSPYSRCRQAGGRGHGDVIAVWWAQVPGPVRAMVVIVRGVLLQDCAQVPRSGDQHPVGDLGPDRPHPALGISVRFRAAGGIFTTSILAPASTASNPSVNCPARSRIRNRNRPARSPRSISRFRACCTVQAPSGWAVTPRT
jgi:hypothetical protein